MKVLSAFSHLEILPHKIVSIMISHRTASLFLFILLSFVLFSSQLVGEELVGFEAQSEVAKHIMLQTKRWKTGIKTWTGRVNMQERRFRKDVKSPYFSEVYDVDFMLDFVNNRKKIVFNLIESITYDAEGTPTYHTLKKESQLIKEGVFYMYDTFSYMPQVPESERSPGGNLLMIDTQENPMSRSFSPLYDLAWPQGSINIDYLFYTFEKSEKTREMMVEREESMSREKIDEFLNELWTNGSQIMTFNRDGDLLTTRRFKEQFCVFDFSKDAMPIKYWSDGASKKRWDCERQLVGGFWIPKAIQNSETLASGSFVERSSLWTDQHINEEIPDKEWELASLGVCRGQEGYDARTGVIFRVEGEEFLPSLAEEEVLDTEATRHRTSRMTFIALGLLLTLIGGFGILRKRMKNTNSPS